MKTPIRSFASFHALSGLVLLLGSVFVGNTAEVPTPNARLPMSPERQAAREARMAKLLDEEAKATVVLRAIGTPGGVPVAMCDLNGEPKLVMEGSELAGQVAEIDVPNSRVTVIRRDNSHRVYTLTEPRPVKFPDFSPQQVEMMIAGMNRGRPRNEGAPIELMRAWGDLSREAKEVILLSYLHSGVVINISSRSSASSARLFERQMIERIQERLQAFLSTLTPEQHKLFRGSSQGLVRLDASPEKQTTVADQNHRAGSNREQLLASLTPEQRKLYDALHSKPEP